ASAADDSSATASSSPPATEESASPSPTPPTTYVSTPPTTLSRAVPTRTCDPSVPAESACRSHSSSRATALMLLEQFEGSVPHLWPLVPLDSSHGALRSQHRCTDHLRAPTFDRSPTRPGRQPLSPEPVTPSTICRWKNMYSTTSGRAARRAPAWMSA